MILEFNEQNFLRNPPCFRFITDSPEFNIKYEIGNIISGEFPNVGVTAREGLTILYKKDANWLNIDTYVRNPNRTIDMRPMINAGEEYEVLIYGPILATIKKLWVTVPNSKNIRLIDNNSSNILIVGGIHSFGIGCTTTGVMFSNLLGRKLNYDIQHLTYNSNNFLRDVFLFLNSNHLPKYDYIIMELDYFNQDDYFVSEYLLEIVNILRNQCTVFIGWSSIPKSKSYKNKKINDLLIDKLEDNSFLFDFSDIYYDYSEICTLNDYFINDSGNIVIFKKLFDFIRSTE